MLQWVSDLETQMDALKDQVKKIQTNSGDGNGNGLVAPSAVAAPTAVAQGQGLALAQGQGLEEGLIALPLELPPAPSIALEKEKNAMMGGPSNNGLPPPPPSPAAAPVSGAAKKVLKKIDQIRKIYGATPFPAASPVLAAGGQGLAPGQGLAGGIQGRQMKVLKTPPAPAVSVSKTPDLVVRREVRERHRNDFQQFVKDKRNEHGNSSTYSSIPI